MSTATAVQSTAAQPRYGILRTVELSYEQALQRVAETLKSQGFGVLWEIDVKDTMKKKLDKDFTPYKILGACNPPIAHRALSEEIDIGLLLPCNVTVYTEPKSGKTVVGAIDPHVLVEATGRQELQPLAEEVSAKLKAALDAI